MSSETRFSTSHSEFWKALLPMSESYIRAENLRPQKFADPLESLSPANQRGIINECGFLMFQEAMRLTQYPSTFSESMVDKHLKTALDYVTTLRQSARAAHENISTAGRREALSIANRLYRFFLNEKQFQAFLSKGLEIIVKPPFPGCGWVNAAEGDVLSGLTLFEVKAGERHFRVADLRQLLCYCALDFSSKRYGIKSIALLNPREGTFIREDLDSMCHKISGTSAANLLSEIVSYVSEPLFRY